MSNYRSELDAALARVQQLEGENAELRARLAETPAVRTRLAELHRRRSVALETLRRMERSGALAVRSVLALTGIGGAIFVAIILSLGAQGHPLNAAILALALMAGTGALTAWLTRASRRAVSAGIERLDAEIAEALDHPEHAERARIAAPMRVESAAEASEVEEEGERAGPTGRDAIR